MITWIKKMWARLRAPKRYPDTIPGFTIVACNHRFETLAVTTRVSDCFEKDRAFDQAWFVRRTMSNQLAEAIAGRLELVKYPDREDPFTWVYAARIKVLFDNGKETK